MITSTVTSRPAASRSCAAAALAGSSQRIVPHDDKPASLAAVAGQRSICFAEALLFLRTVRAVPFLNFMPLFDRTGFVPCLRKLRLSSMRENTMRAIFAVIICLGAVTTAYAQTTRNTGTDPLSVPTSSLPSTSSFSSGPSSAAGGSAAGGSATMSGSVETAGPAGRGTSGIDAPASPSSQAPLELPGERLNTSTQIPGSTAAAPAAPSPICAPPIPTTDGGPANITGAFSPGGC